MKVNSMNEENNKTGTQSIIVTGADGKKRRVIQRLPRTHEEEQRYKIAEKLIRNPHIHHIDYCTDDFSNLVSYLSKTNDDRMKDFKIMQDLKDFHKLKNSEKNNV